jgi:hypothetical protein
MQATLTRTAYASRTLLVMLVLLVGLIVGGVGGYFISDLSRTVPRTPGASLSPSADIAGSMARHAATERAEADSATGSALAQSMARHAATERADANPWALSAP